MVLFISLVLHLAYADCDLDLTITRRTVTRLGVESSEYAMLVDPLKSVSLRVTSRSLVLKEIKGLRRMSRATRALNLEGAFADRLDEMIRVHELIFVPTDHDRRRHRFPSSAKSLRDQFDADFAARARLLDALLEHAGSGSNVYQYSFTNEILAWQDLADVAELGETRFATQTWLAGYFRRRGVKGALMSGGTLPTVRMNLADLPLHPNEGPTVLFFRPARP